MIAPEQQHHLRLMQARYTEICPPLYKETDLNHPGINYSATKQVLGWKYSAGCRGMILQGDTGRGKTRSVWMLIKRLLCEEAIPVRSITDPSFSREYSMRLANGTAGEWIEKLSRCCVLFIDDVGKASVTARYKEQLYDILETRMARQRPVIVTTQFHSPELIKHFGENDSRAIIRRITETCDVIHF